MSTNGYDCCVELRRLDERTDRAWRGFNAMRNRLTAHLGRQLYQESGLTQAEYVVLFLVSEAPNRRLRSRDLGLALGWDRSRLSHQIKRMQTRGMVQRAACDGDARGFDVIMTDVGLDAIRVAEPHLADGVRHCFADLLTVEQLDTLGDIAEIILAHLAAEHDD
jgi:DNA-binding MarR family transcriptional regulator